MLPAFERELIEEKTDGSRVIRDEQGLLVLEKPGIVSIPAEIGTTLTDRKSWEELYLPRLQWHADRVDANVFQSLTPSVKELRDVGGMNKTVFAKDYKAIDEEIERLKHSLNSVVIFPVLITVLHQMQNLKMFNIIARKCISYACNLTAEQITLAPCPLRDRVLFYCIFSKKHSPQRLISNHFQQPKVMICFSQYMISQQRQYH